MSASVPTYYHTLLLFLSLTMAAGGEEEGGGCLSKALLCVCVATQKYSRTPIW